MEINVQCLGFKSSANLEQVVSDKLQKLEPLTHKIIRANVTFFQDGSEPNENNYCEIRLEAPGNDPFVKKHGPSYEQSISEAVDALQTILRKNKEKLETQRHGG